MQRPGAAATVVVMMTLVTSTHAAPRTEPYFAFRAGFWNSLHHFLYVLGRDQNRARDRTRRAVSGAPKELDTLSSFPGAVQEAWAGAVDGYAAAWSRRDAVFDADLAAMTRTLAAAPDASDLEDLGLDPALVQVLHQAAPVYRTAWWPSHAAANAARVRELQELATTHGARAVTRLETIFGGTWPTGPRVIDVAPYTNWAGAYSTTGGLIEVSSLDPATSGSLGLETLLHEATHQWDDQLQARLARIAATRSRPVPEQLSHALVFYTAGEVARELVPGHEPYAARFGLWGQGPMAALKAPLDECWRPYLRGEGSFDEAVTTLLRLLP